MKPGPATSADSTSSAAAIRVRELLGELARRPPDLLRRPHGDVRREVAVRRVLRPLELDLDAERFAEIRAARRSTAEADTAR